MLSTDEKIKNIIDEQNMQIRELMKVTDTITCDGMQDYARTQMILIQSVSRI